ncbi:MAG: pyridoxamine 5'-phosphate oxidase family protein [Candidatus Promineifilaceae bacterium]
MQLNSKQVWDVINKEIFAVIGMVTAQKEARTVGVVYIVQNQKLYISSQKDAWKARHIASNSAVSLTIPIAKRIPLMPWIKIPAATITFSGQARVFPAADAPKSLLQAILREAADDPAKVADTCLIEVTPEKEFVTYGVGVSLMQMRDTSKARGRAPVA